MANNEVVVRLVAEDRISKKLDEIAKNIQKIEQIMSKSTTNMASSTAKASKNTETLNEKLNRLKETAKKTKSDIGDLNNSLNTLFTGYIGFKGLDWLTDKVDDTISTVNRLNYVNYQTQSELGVSPDELYDPTTGGYTERVTSMTSEAMDKIYSSSRKVRGNYSEMLKDVSKLTTLAGDAFDNNVDNAIRFQEIMTEAYTIGGASAQEIHSSMYQMVQALGSGVLQGDELRSVREGAPLAYKAIEKFAKKVYKTETSLKDLASQGKITSDMVVKAIMSASGEMDEAFAMTSVTFGQTMDMISSYATKAFEPVFIKIGEILSSDMFSKFVSEIESVISILANGFMLVLNFFSYMESNFANVTEGVIKFTKYLVLALVTLQGFLITKVIGHSFGKLVGAVLALNPVMKIVLASILAIGLAFSIFEKDMNAFLNYVPSGIELLGALITALSLAFVVLGIVAFMTGGTIASAFAPVLIAIGVVIAIIGLLAYAFITNAEYIVGFVNGAITAIFNVIKFLIRSIIAITMLIVSPVVALVEIITSVWNGGWEGMRNTLNTILKDMSNKILDFALVATRLLDKVFHTDFSSGIEARKSAIKEWAKEAEVETSVSAYGKIDKVVTESFAYGNIGEAYDKGSKKGQEITETITTNADSLRNKLFDKLNAVTSKLNKSSDINKETELNLTDIDGTLGNIDDNTKKTADNTSLSEDDVKYLRDLAEMEWKKEFTTASIQIDMNNVNNISSEMDLDGIVTYLTEELYNQAEQFTDGVYI